MTTIDNKPTVTTSHNTKGDYLSINLGFALGTTFGIYIAKGVSGAHLNPAVSLSLCVLGRFSWTRFPFYVWSQILGAFLAAATVALQYYDAIMEFTGGHLTVRGATGTAGIFSTYPADYLSLWGGVVDQIIGTAALLVCVLALGDPHNTPAPPGLEPVLVGAVVLVIGISMGSNSGYAINPARDIGPRLFSYIAGWGDEVFRAGHGWWWVPLVVTCVGALLGSLLYELLIGVHHPDSEPMDPEGLTAKVPIVVPALVVIVSCYLVLAPIIDKPEWEYLYCTAFIVSGLLLYVPLIYYKFNWTRHIMRPLTMHLQLLLQVVPHEKIE
ncbi:aquaporin-7 [Pimephales promelas]|nr:aquaporin-7 [Pimephales promelas]